ncbi:uncharacterized protein [Notamacropus eugenii]|uniref:uncharacterized protein isoform X1 n=1 Tax=Notamacropus eugenii TaxID=9315 RepID=UPI003B678394
MVAPRAVSTAASYFRTKTTWRSWSRWCLRTAPSLVGPKAKQQWFPRCLHHPRCSPKCPGTCHPQVSSYPSWRASFREQQSAEKCLVASKARTASQKLSFVHALEYEETSVPKEQVESLADPASGTSSMGLPEARKVKDMRPAQSVAKLWMAQPASPEDVAPVLTESGDASSSLRTLPQPETELLLDLPESPWTRRGSRCDLCSVCRIHVHKSSQAQPESRSQADSDSAAVPLLSSGERTTAAGKPEKEGGG